VTDWARELEARGFEDFIEPARLANFIGRRPRWVLQQCRLGNIPAIQFGREWKIGPRVELVAWFEAGCPADGRYRRVAPVRSGDASR
jgi:hypothetical protein